VQKKGQRRTVRLEGAIRGIRPTIPEDTMTNEELAAGMTEVKQTVEAQTAGLLKMLGVLATQTSMLKDILAAVTAEPEGESPLLQALKKIAAILEWQSAKLEHIENTMEKEKAGQH
jgi:hypothetical protein